MGHPATRLTGLALLLGVALGGPTRPLSAQAAGSTYVLVAGRIVNAAVAQDAQYGLVAHLGAFEAGSTSGGGLTLTGGPVALIDSPITGTGAVPWPLAVQPPFIDLESDQSPRLVLLGAELDTGGALAVSVGDTPATVVSVTKPAVTLALPPLRRPGFQPVRVTGQQNVTAAVPGLGVRPLLRLEEPAAPDRPLRLVCHGHPGDQVWIGVSIGSASDGVRVPPFHHRFSLSPSTFALVGAFPITAADGRLRIVMPPPGVTAPVVVQGLVIAGGLAGYAPGSFTNAVGL